jgi:hypothetical protein
MTKKDVALIVVLFVLLAIQSIHPTPYTHIAVGGLMLYIVIYKRRQYVNRRARGVG